MIFNMIGPPSLYFYYNGNNKSPILLESDFSVPLKIKVYRKMLTLTYYTISLTFILPLKLIRANTRARKSDNKI